MSTVQDITSHSLNLDPDTIRSSRYRLGTISSISRSDNLSKGDRVSFRKLAKSLWNDLGVKKPLSGHVTSNNAVAEVLSSSKLESFSLSNLTHRYYHRKTEEEYNPWRSYFDSRLAYERSMNLGHKTLSSEVILPPSSRQSKRVVSPTNALELNVSYYDKFDAYSIKKGDPEGKRVLMLKNVSPFVGLKSFLAQVCGGPLQKVVVHKTDPNRADKFSQKNLSIELWFLKPVHAENFFNYTKSGLFLVNGFHHYVDWAPKHHTGSSIMYHEPVPKDVEEMALDHDASRILVIKKYVRKPKTQNRHYPSPSAHFSQLDVSKIKMDFSAFGDIVEVRPMISKKLCVSVHYYDVQSAIAAKRLLDQTDDFAVLYRDWSIFYSKDITDKPIVSVT
jgi:hypothetical protein